MNVELNFSYIELSTQALKHGDKQLPGKDYVCEHHFIPEFSNQV